MNRIKRTASSSRAISSLLVLLMVLMGRTRATGFHSHTLEAYRVLGVTKEATSKEIQKRYRVLCLKYHPDKNTRKPLKQRKKAEETFKQVQHAYSLIGDDQSRRSYEAQQQFGTAPSSHNGSPPYGSDPVSAAFYHAFQKASANGGSPAFFFSTGATGQRFGFRTDATPFPVPAGSNFKSIFLQKISVPLEDLYKGMEECRLRLKDNWWTRFRAAVRGRIIFLNLYQGFIYSLPIWRKSGIFALLVACCIVHATLPKPTSTYFETALRKGTKGGKTKVKFASTSFGVPEIVFDIVEAPHRRYKRIGNDLHTTLRLTREQAHAGGKFCVAALDTSLPPLDVQVPPNTSSGTIITIEGKGWPIRSAPPDVYVYGDVKVQVVLGRERYKKQ